MYFSVQPVYFIPRTYIMFPVLDVNITTLNKYLLNLF